MSRPHYIALASAVALFLAMYFGCDTKSKAQYRTEQSRSLSMEGTDVNALIAEARPGIAAAPWMALQALMGDLAAASDTAAKALLYQQVSGRWYELGHPAIAGHYAQELAELRGTEEAWAITGTTFTLCVRQSDTDKVRDFCTKRAVRAFENALSLNPANTAHQVNLALCYADNPPPENPMKGILMLVDLNKQQPENVLVLNTLARLALQTGQTDRALERLSQALALEPENTATNCLLANAYDAAGQQAKAAEYTAKCQALRDSGQRPVQ